MERESYGSIMVAGQWRYGVGQWWSEGNRERGGERESFIVPVSTDEVQSFFFSVLNYINPCQSNQNNSKRLDKDSEAFRQTRN